MHYRMHCSLRDFRSLLNKWKLKNKYQKKGPREKKYNNEELLNKNERGLWSETKTPALNHRVEKTRLRRMRSEKDFVEKQKGYLTKDKGYQVTINWLPVRKVENIRYSWCTLCQRKNHMLPVRHGCLFGVILRIHNSCTRSRIPETLESWLLE